MNEPTVKQSPTFAEVPLRLRTSKVAVDKNHIQPDGCRFPVGTLKRNAKYNVESKGVVYGFPLDAYIELQVWSFGSQQSSETTRPTHCTAPTDPEESPGDVLL